MLKRQRQHVMAKNMRQASLDGQVEQNAPSGVSPECDNATPSTSHTDTGDLDTAWLDDDTIDLIAQTVEDFRGQRLSMVQSLRQFVLCYETVLEWIARLQQQENGTAMAGTVAAMGGRSRSESFEF